jgi:signal transduction histidine kinase
MERTSVSEMASARVLGDEDHAVLGAFAHDVRSIAAAAEGLAFRALGAAADPRSKAYLDAIRGSMERLSAMARAALEFARSGHPEIGTFEEEVELAEVLEAAAAIINEDFFDAGIALVVECAPVRIRADRTAIYRVGINLLRNALVHGGRRGGSVKLSLARTTTGARIVVEDDGPGFPRTFVTGGGLPSWTAGRGLGLAIVARIAARHGGTLSIGNRTPTGARIVVVLEAGAEAP